MTIGFKQSLYYLIASAFLMLILQSCSSILPAQKSSEADEKEVFKSNNDLRQYRHITLDNNLDVLLISDPSTDKAAASLDVYIGSYQNPRDRMGLAHFLEHMLFLGTEKYPHPGEYQAFISEHGGSHNAYTSLENTNYFFDIDVDYLEQTLDRFAPFFSSPTFDSAYVDRERNAVESEYRLKIKDDSRRQWDVLREQLNQQHPQSKFAVGNLVTLADRPNLPLRDDLIAMYKQYYSANLMKLVVLGANSLDELEAMVSSRFSAIEDKQVQIGPQGKALIEASRLPLEIHVKPIKELRELTLMFEIPVTAPNWRTKPSQFVSQLIGREGAGSLLEALKTKGWAESLGAGLSLEDRNSALYTVNIGLTEDGFNNRTAIVEQVFAWIGLIKEQGVEAWRQEELAAMGEINFRYIEKQDPSRYVAALASKMQKYPAHEVVREPYLITEFDTDAINSILDRLIPANLIMMVTGPDLPTDKISDYYQVPYAANAIDSLEIELWQSAKPFADLELPVKNRFIPSDLSLIEPRDAKQVYPALISQTPGLRVWHLENIEFGVPRGNVIVYLGTDQTSTIEQITSAQLYVDLVRDQLNSELYAASLAGLNYSIGVDRRGVSIVLGGFTESQPLLLKAVLEVFKNPDWSEARFERVKQRLLRMKLNAIKGYPFRQVVARLSASMQGGWVAADQVPIIEKLSLLDLQRYGQRLLRGFDAEVIISGNHSLRTANLLADELTVFATMDISHPFMIAQLSESDFSESIAVDHNDAVVVQYIQGDSDSIEERAKLSLIAQMMSAPFFNSLRTEQQLGYVVSAFPFHINRVPGLAMLVQSPVASESQLREEFKRFIQEFASTIEQLSEEEFGRHQSALLTNLEETPKSIGELNGRFAESLRLGYTDFTFRDQLAAEISKLTITEVQNAFQRVVVDSPRQLWVQTQGAELKDQLKTIAEYSNATYSYSY